MERIGAAARLPGTLKQEHETMMLKRFAVLLLVFCTAGLTLSACDAPDVEDVELGEGVDD